MRNHRKSFPHRQTKIKGALLLIFGLALILSPHVFSHDTIKSEQPIRPDTAFSISAIGKPPIRIIIPAIALDVPVNTSAITNGYWEVSEDSASFGLGSAPPASVGNTVIFAHAREHLFLPLKDIAVNDVIYIMTDSQWFTYQVKEIKEVLPSDTYVIAATKEKQLTLFTCSGFFDSKRLVVTAKPQ